ncbi:MAG: hypothetical protein QNJ04_12855 [Desulfobacterales bacterium]|nr:hypothetical protein [Desulfobacterales bacterium]
MQDVQAVAHEAFGSGKEAGLVQDRLGDPGAWPFLSLLTIHNDRAEGNIRFTRAVIAGVPERRAVNLAPMVVVPGAQKKGIGDRPPGSVPGAGRRLCGRSTP